MPWLRGRSQRAQRSAAPRVGILSPLSPSADASSPFAIFRKTLLDLDCVEGRFISLEYRWADGNSARLGDFAAKLVDLKVDVIFCGPGTPTAIAAKQNSTARIPIVLVGAGDAVGVGLVESLAHPGGNVTRLRVGKVFPINPRELIHVCRWYVTILSDL